MASESGTNTGSDNPTATSVEELTHPGDDTWNPTDDCRVAGRGQRGRGYRLGDDRVEAVIAQSVCHAHQRAAGADTGDEAMEPTIDLLDELRSGRVSMGEHVARVLELPGGVQIVPGFRIEQGCYSASHSVRCGGEDDVAPEAADHQHSLPAHRLGHVRPKWHADAGANHAQRD